MNWTSIWREVDNRIARRLAQSSIVRRMVLEAVTATTFVPEVAGEGLAGEQLDGVELFQHFGFRSIPPVGSEAIALRVGGAGGHLVVVATAGRPTVPTDLVDGDSTLYSSTGARVDTKADGTVAITAALAGLVNLNGGTAGVARLGDSVSITLDSATMTTLAASLITAGLVMPGTPVAAPVPVTASGTITTGSATVVCGD